MDPITTGALFSAASGVLSNLVNNVSNWFGAKKTTNTNIKEAEKNRKWQEDQASLAYQRQVELWNKNNAYNDPSAQMDRYKKAGLNPYLVSGNQAGLADMPSAPAAGSGANADAIAPRLSFIDPIASAIQSGATLRLSNSQANLNDANTYKANQEAFATEIKNQYLSIEKELDLAVKRGAIKESEKKVALMNFQIEGIRLENAYNRLSMQDRLVQQYGAAQQSLFDIQMQAVRRASMIQSIKESLSRTELNNANRELAGINYLLGNQEFQFFGSQLDNFNFHPKYSNQYNMGLGLGTSLFNFGKKKWNSWRSGVDSH